MVKVNLKLYRKFITTNAKGKPVLYVQLEKAVYGMMKSALLFYRKHVADLLSLGFTINPYDPYVANKTIKGKQMMIRWHVDDLFIGHEDPTVVTHFLHWLTQRYNTRDKKLNVVRGPKHDYLGMNLDFSRRGAVTIKMTPYIKKSSMHSLKRLRGCNPLRPVISFSKFGPSKKPNYFPRSKPGPITTLQHNFCFYLVFDGIFKLP